MDMSKLRKLAGLPEIIVEKKDDGLQGPYTLKSGKEVWYDTKEKKYYDKKTDLFVDNDEVAELQNKAADQDKLDEANNFIQPQEDEKLDNSIEDRTGATEEQESVTKLPKDLIDQVNKRKKELSNSIEKYDNKGYNDKSLKQQCIDCIDQLMKDLGDGDLESIKKAQIFYGTLMGPILDTIPPKLVKFITKGVTENEE